MAGKILTHKAVLVIKDGLCFYSQLKLLNRIKCHNLTYFPKTAITQYALDHHLLAEEELTRLEQGDILNFFHGDTIRDRTLKTAKDAFSTCYKWLPVIPKFIIRRLIRSEDCRWFGAIPGPFIIFGQLLVAVKGRDYRYLIFKILSTADKTVVKENAGRLVGPPIH